MPLKIVQDSPDDALNSIQSKLVAANAERDAAQAMVKDCDKKIRELINSAPPKPRDSAEKLRENMKKLEDRRMTSSMSLNEEKKIIKEIEGASKLLKTIVKYEVIQNQINELREQKDAANGIYRTKDSEGKELKTESTQMRISSKLGVEITDLINEVITIPEEWVGAVIGKKGARKAEIENDCSVELNVDVKECTIKITGTPATIQKAKDTIKGITDAVTEECELDSDKFNILLSNKGALLKETQSEYGVRVDLKRGDDDKLTGEFVVKGLPKNVKQAIAAIKEASSGFQEFECTEKQLPSLIGKGGAVIRKLQEDSGASIDINRDGPSLKIRGSKRAVSAAVALIEAIMEENAEIEVEFPIAKEFVSAIVGAKGVVIQQMQKDSGFCKFDVVKDDPENPLVRIRGRKDQLEEGKRVFHETLAKIETQFRSMPLSPAMCSVVIGKAGATIKKLQEDSGARISYDRKNNVLRLKGEGDDAAEQMDKAEELIKALLKENEICEVPVTDLIIQVLLSKKGEEISKLQEATGGLNINVNKESNTLVLRGPEEKAEIAKALLKELEQNNQSLEIAIADEDMSLLIGPKGATINKISEESGTKVNIVRSSSSVRVMGSEEALEKAKAMINELLNGADGGLCQIMDIEDDSMGALIGPKGATIKKLQEEHDVKIDLLRSRDCIRLRANGEGDDAAAKVTQCVKEIGTILANVRLTTTIKCSKRVTEGRLWGDIKGVGGELDVSINYKEESKEGHPVIIISGSGSAVNAAKQRITEIMTGKAMASIVLLPKHCEHLEKTAATLAKIEVDENCKIELNSLKNTVNISGMRSDVSKGHTAVLAALGFFFPTDFAHHTIPPGSSAFFMKANKKVLRTVEEASGVKMSVDSENNRIHICGEEEAIAAAKESLTDAIATFEKQNASIVVEKAMVPSVIGKKGANINKLCTDTGATIKVDSAGGLCRITGDEESVAKALETLTAMKAKWQKENKIMEVDPAVVGTIIGKKGAVIRELTEQTGCQIDVDSASGVIRLRGDEDKIAAAEARINEKLAENKIVRMDIDDRDFRLIIGTKGATIRQIQEDSGASIDLDRDASQIAFRGKEEECEKAKELVNEILEASRLEREKRAAEREAERAAEDAEWEKKRAEGGSGGGGGDGGGEKQTKEEVDYIFQYDAVPLGADPNYAHKSPTSKSAARRARKKATQENGDDENEVEVLGLKKPAKKAAPPKPVAKPGEEFKALNKAYAIRL